MPSESLATNGPSHFSLRRLWCQSHGTGNFDSARDLNRDLRVSSSLSSESRASSESAGVVVTAIAPGLHSLQVASLSDVGYPPAAPSTVVMTVVMITVTGGGHGPQAPSVHVRPRKQVAVMGEEGGTHPGRLSRAAPE